MPPTTTEVPEHLYVQLTANGGTVSYLRDPREVHDNGKPVYVYVRRNLSDAAIARARVEERERCAKLAESWEYEDKVNPARWIARAIREGIEAARDEGK